MEGAAILFILAIAGVASMALSTMKKILNEVPDVLNSASQARDAWERFKQKHNEQPPVTVPEDDEEQPPAAA